MLKVVREYYGLGEGFEEDLLFVNEKGEKKVYMTTEKVKELFLSDEKQQMRKINLGVKVFEKNKDKFMKMEGLDSFYRLMQSGIDQVFPYMTKKKYEVSMAELLKVCYNPNLRVDMIEEEFVKLREIASNADQGCFVVYAKGEKGDIQEMIVC